MTRGKFRPWGLLNWVLDKAPDTKWSVFGCLGTERRSIAAWEEVRESDRLAKSMLLRIDDPPSAYDKAIRERLALRRQEWEDAGGRIDWLSAVSPDQSIDVVVQMLREFLNTSGASVIIDITSLPKRIFFPALKILLRERRISNLIATYSIPASYPDVPIAEDFAEWQPLPTFSGSSAAYAKPDLIVVGVGFMAMRLTEVLSPGGRTTPVNLLFPFPPGPPSYQRSWEMVRELERARRGNLNVIRVDANDASNAFEHLCNLTNYGEKTPWLAPFGPKPLSLAMCLLAVQKNFPVYYTQPRAYHPDYSLGISYVDDKREIYAYCLRLNGKDLYIV